MTGAHYVQIKTAIDTLLEHNPMLARQYHAKQLTMTRFAWDLFWATGVGTTELYKYLNDAHITTALHRIVRETWESTQ